MNRVVLLIWLALLTGPALAQGVPVRSGAHDGFDRLVLDLPGRLGWRAETSARGATIIFDDSSLRFDLAAVFTRIDRARLRALAAPPGQGRLVLDFACDCALRTFWHATSMLVLDIVDPPASSRTTAAGERRPPVDHPAGPVLLPAELPSPAASVLAARLAADVAREPGQGRDVPAPAATAPDLAGMRTLLLHQLGRAATQGLVSAAPRARLPVRPAPVAAPGPPPPAPPGTTGPAPPATPLGPDGPIALSAHTSMDRDLPDARQTARAPSPERAACPAPDALDVPSWGGGAGLPAEMGQIHRRLFAEFDAIDAQAARALVRLYIHHGFGAEARQILALGVPDDAEARLLGELALIVDHEPVPETATLRHVAACGEPTVLWALLARPGLAADLVFDHRALQRAFAALPPGLRRSLGPGLVRRLAAVGNVGTAHHLQRLTEGVVSPDDPEASLGRAELAARMSEPEEAALATAGRSNTVHAAEALARRIENALSRGAPVGVEQAQLAGAYAFELRDTAMGDRLAAAHVAALATAGAFEEAVVAFERLDLAPERPAARTIAATLMRAIARNGDDVTFLRHALSERILPREHVEPALGGTIARRLLDAGFAAAADRYLLSVEADPALLLLRAEIALARRRPGEAELSLVSLEGPEADRLRARARMMRGDHDSARALFADSEAMPEADRAAFLARDLGALAGAADPLLRALSRIRQDGPGRDGAETALSQSRAVLREAGEARDILTRLLAETPDPEAADG